MKILIADDHAAVREALAGTLKLEPGLQVVAEAGNGEDAVRLVEELRPDVVRPSVLDGPADSQAGCADASPRNFGLHQNHPIGVSGNGGRLRLRG